MTCSDQRIRDLVSSNLDERLMYYTSFSAEEQAEGISRSLSKEHNICVTADQLIPFVREWYADRGVVLPDDMRGTGMRMIDIFRACAERQMVGGV